MHVLIIGYSAIVKKRVIPALAQISDVVNIDIASQSSRSEIRLVGTFEGQFFGNYEEALTESKANLVYVSTVNSLHAKWVEKAVRKGLHVIVDKPAFTSIKDTKRLVELSRKKKLCLAESTVYAYHPQIRLASDIFLRANSEPKTLTATFSFPPLNQDNFRYNADLGGGALFDLGPYAVSLGRVFFGEYPKEIFCRCHKRNNESNVDTGFSAMAVYSHGRSMLGCFGFDTEYRNCLNMLGPNVSLDMERVFTTPADMANIIQVKQYNKSTIVKVPKADSFLIFLAKIINGIQTDNHLGFADDLLADAVVLHKMRAVANEV